jgi:hypothetical protein|tara:strand:- start:3 stop:470 length:468 start_codon:yes stop_codon:yes gene_type:complete
MSKLKTISILLSFLILINHCGYTAQYAKKRDLDFSIQINNLTGDRDFNNSLKSELNRYFNIEKAKIKNFKINATSKYDKNTILKDSSGKPVEYELKITVNFEVNIDETKKNIVIKDSFEMKKIDDAFEENKYEKTIKNNFAKIIKEELIFYLLRM